MNKRNYLKRFLTEAKVTLSNQFPETINMTTDELYNFFITEISALTTIGDLIISNESTKYCISEHFRGIDIPLLDELGLQRAHEIKH